jgi:hypothetical protein
MLRAKLRIRLALLAAAVGAGAAGVMTSQDAPATTAGALATQHALEIGGRFVGWLSSATVASDRITVAADLQLPAPLLALVRAHLAGEAQAFDGAVVVADASLRERGRRSFRGARIVEVAFPGMEAGSSEVAPVAITFTWEHAAQVAGRLTPVGEGAPPALATRAASFRLDVQGLALGPVAKLAPIVSKAGASELRLTVTPADPKPWLDWYTAFIQGAGDRKGQVIGLDLLDDKGGALLSFSPRCRPESVMAAPSAKATDPAWLSVALVCSGRKS